MKVIMYLLGLYVVLFFVGCQSEGRPSSRSEFNIPAQWRSSVNSTNSVLARWWLQFNNPNLNALVEEGLSNNLDIQIAHKRMELARVQARMVDFSSRPRLNASINGEKRRSNYIGLPFGDGGVIKSRTENYGSNLSVNWEVDLWGRIRNAKNAAKMDVYAADLDSKAAAHSLIGQVVKVWFSLGEASELVELLREQIDIAKLALKQVEIRYKLGNASTAELKRSEANVAHYESRLSDVSSSIVRNSRTLELLLGRNTGDKVLHWDKLPVSLADIPVGLPSGVLERRPDIAASIIRIRAAELRVAEAQSSLLPQLSLTGSAGTSSNQLKDLLDGNFLVWGLGGNLAQSILLPDERKTRVLEREVYAEKFLLEHRAIVLQALSEVEQALEVGVYFNRQLSKSLEAATKHGELIEIYKARHANGVGSLRDLLEAQRLYVDSKMNWVRLKRYQIDNRVNLHLALGGGFEFKGGVNEANTTD